MSDLGSAWRLWHAARVLARHDALLPVEYRDRLPRGARIARLLLGRSMKPNVTPPATRLAQALGSLGPAYIKLGQMLATRPDIVGAPIAGALQQLQDRLPPFTDKEARNEVGAAL